MKRKLQLSKIDKLVLSAAKSRKKWAKFCPQCRSTDVVLDARWLNQFTYRCRKCGHISQSFPEKAV